MDEFEQKAVERHENLATELLSELKRTIKLQWTLIVILIVLLAGTNIYHIYEWSQFDTVVVDSKDGGNASYIGNDGDVNNYGTGYSAETQADQQAEVEGNTN